MESRFVLNKNKVVWLRLILYSWWLVPIGIFIYGLTTFEPGTFIFALIFAICLYLLFNLSRHGTPEEIIIEDETVRFILINRKQILFRKDREVRKYIPSSDLESSGYCLVQDRFYMLILPDDFKNYSALRSTFKSIWPQLEDI